MRKKSEAKGSKKGGSLLWLRNLNLVFFVIYVAEAVAILLLSKTVMLSITSSYQVKDSLQSTVVGQTVTAQATSQIFSINMAYLVACFLLILGLSHLLSATVLRGAYERQIQTRVHVARWIFFSLSTGLMLIALSLLIGISDLLVLIAVFCLTAMATLMVLKNEYLTSNGSKVGSAPSWLKVTLPVVAGILPWIMLVITILQTSFSGDGVMPSYALWATGTIFVLFLLMAIVIAKGRLKSSKPDLGATLSEERLFATLCLFASSALAWQVFSGLLRP